MSTEQNSSKDDKPSFWRMAIETWTSSGLSVRQFCKLEGLSEPSFYSWRKKLAMQDSKDTSEPSAFIEVAIQFGQMSIQQDFVSPDQQNPSLDPLCRYQLAACLALYPGRQTNLPIFFAP
jgi:hypothetical protein